MKTENSDNRLLSFDILKLICSFMVVCIHAPFSGTFGSLVDSLSKVAVPIFFMITGFFYHNTIFGGSTKLQIKKIFKLMISSNILFFIFNSLTYQDGIISYAKRCFTVKKMIDFIFFNQSMFNGHLWYLGALLYVLIIIYLFDKFNIRKILYIATPFLLLVNLCLGKYSLIIFNTYFNHILSRNFLFLGIPYFCIGTLIYKYQSKIDNMFSKKKLMLYVIMCLLSVLSFIEYVKVDSFYNENNISTIFLSLNLFIIFMLNFKNVSNKILLILSYIGRKYSTMIYILHPMFIYLITQLNIKYINNIMAIVVFIVTLIVSIIFYYTKNKIKKISKK